VTPQGTLPGIFVFVLLDKKPSKLGTKKLPERIIMIAKQPLKSQKMLEQDNCCHPRKVHPEQSRG